MGAWLCVGCGRRYPQRPEFSTCELCDDNPPCSRSVDEPNVTEAEIRCFHHAEFERRYAAEGRLVTTRPDETGAEQGRKALAEIRELDALYGMG